MLERKQIDQSNFFPTFVQLSSLLRIKADILDTKRKVAIGADILKELIAKALANVTFDPDWYLETYPDIREAWEKRRIEDLKAHFINTGYFEGRLPNSACFDENWYLSTYPDVSEAIAAGQVKSAFEHYLRNGQLEWRSPDRLSEPEVEKWRKIGSQG
jgi:hypothetical protein